MTLVAGSHVIRAGMVVQLATVKHRDGRCPQALVGATPEYVLNLGVVPLFFFFLSSPL
jgi:hypothetical protein